MRYQPVNMICGVVFISVLIGLLSLIDAAAANALFSLAVAANDLSWLTPILARLVWGGDRFVPGEFYTGKYLSKPIAWVAVIYMIFAIILCMFPTEGPNPTREFLIMAFLSDHFAKCRISREHELHYCYQWSSLAWLCPLLCSLCKEDLHGSSEYGWTGG